jgi:hypothetical protein
VHPNYCIAAKPGVSLKANTVTANSCSAPPVQ